jgi:dihydrofolate reductase
MKNKAMKLSVFIATSLDGFIARKDGAIDWLTEADTPDENEDFGYARFIATVDCMIMGRSTLEKVITFPEWSYEGMRVVVLSNTLTEVPEQLKGKIELYAGPLTELVEKLSADGVQRAYVDGGKTIQNFLSESLITDITINTIPVLLGEGLPLFGKIPGDIKLTHQQTVTYPIGFVMSTYSVQNS